MRSVLKKIRRLTIRYYVKIVKEKADPEYIARGWAIGMFYGCLIHFGFQLILSIPTSFLLKGSKVGASLGTLLTNPVSIWVIYPVQCYVGSRLLNGNLNFNAVSISMAKIMNPELHWYEAYQTLFNLGWHLVASFFIGGFILTGIMTPLTYWFVKRLVIRYREKKKNGCLEKSE